MNWNRNCVVNTFSTNFVNLEKFYYKIKMLEGIQHITRNVGVEKFGKVQVFTHNKVTKKGWAVGLKCSVQVQINDELNKYMLNS